MIMLSRELEALFRSDFLSFFIKVFHTVNAGSRYVHNWHVELITYCLQQALVGEGTRWVINIPPRSLKSLIISVAWPAFLLGRNPSTKIIVISYGWDLAGPLHLAFERVMESDWYKQVFPNVKVTKNADGRFETSEGGMRLATSVGGALTGLGADIIILDDPIKADQALSRGARDSIHEFYQNTVVSRLNDKTTGIILLVMQRLHDDDLAGRLIASEQFKTLCLPAIATEREEIDIGRLDLFVRSPGDVLQPRHEPRESLERIQKEIGSAKFAAQYQQAPAPASGNLISPEWFCYGEGLPRQAGDRIVQSWDTAMKDEEIHDYSVCTTWLQRGSRHYLLEVIRKRLRYPDLERLALETYDFHRPDTVLIEDKGSGTSLLQSIRRKIGVAVGRKPEGDKAVRLGSVSGIFEAGNIFLPPNAAWRADYEGELLKFPQSRHDDQVDSTTQYLLWAQEKKWDIFSADFGYDDPPDDTPSFLRPYL